MNYGSAVDLDGSLISTADTLAEFFPTNHPSRQGLVAQHSYKI